MRLKFFLLTFLWIITSTVQAQTKSAESDVFGRWRSSENNLEIEIYKEGGEIKSKIVWFKLDDGKKPMEEWTDTKNPNKALRTRKLLGLNVVKGLVYDAKSRSWEHGTIYDALSGHYWDASARLTNDGLLKVIGYWHFKFIGRTMTFKKV